MSEESHFHSAFSYRGFSRIEGVRCKEVGAISLESNSYRQAVVKLMTDRPQDFTKYRICLKKGTAGYIEASRNTEMSTDKSDFVIQYTGKITTGSIEGTFLESQLSFLYNQLNKRDAAELHAIEQQMCFEARGNWILEEALKQQDPNLYVQSILARKADSREYSGYVRDRTVYF